MAQIVGARCAKCTQEIDNPLAAGPCSACRQPVHHRCRHSDTIADSTNVCPECGSAVPSKRLQVDPGAQDRLIDDFQDALFTLTPRVWVTPMLVGANVIVFILMVISGANFRDPTIPELLRWGALWGPSAFGGEWWRLLSCVFIHVGIIHLLFNSYVLAVSGPLVERMVGSVGFLILYLLSGLTGSFASALAHPMTVSAGASGAIFGVFGALLGVLMFQRDSIPPRVLRQLRNSGVTFLAINLIFGAVMPNIDNAAHIGGLLGGLLCGVALSQPLRASSRSHRPLQNLIVGALGTGVVVVIFLAARHRLASDLRVQAELKEFPAWERAVGDKALAVKTRMRGDQAPNRELANVLEHDVHSEWKDKHQQLARLHPTSPRLHRRLKYLIEYTNLRQQEWKFEVEWLRSGDVQARRREEEMRLLANELIRKYNQARNQ